MILLAGFRTFAAAQATGPVIAAYVYPGAAALAPGQIDARGVNRVNYAFANIQDGRAVLEYPQDAANLAFLTGLKRQNSALTVLLSVGGWSWSKHFSDAALTEENRQVFIGSAMDLIERYDLDGLDVDWEYPGQPGAGNVYRSQDIQNFTLLMMELRQRFDRETAQTHKRLYLTMAAEASDEYLEHTQMGRVQNYVDTVNLMAYDYYIPGSDRRTGNIAPLFESADDPKQVSANQSVLAMEQAGVPAAKIALGVPFYGAAWRDVANRNHGLFQRGKGGPDASLPYDVITKTMIGHGFTRYWDAASSAPYLYSPEQRIFVSYEDPQSLAAKCRYAIKHKLAGMVFWNYSSDPSGTLLRAIDQGLQASAPAP